MSVHSVDVLVPVLDRPSRVEPLITSLSDSRAEGVRELFICSPDDRAELAEIDAHHLRKLVMPYPRQPGDYARKINAGARQSDAEWLFLGADDLNFRPGWLAACLAVADETGAAVIGTNDLGNPMVKMGMHSTHTLVRRSYVELGTVDDPNCLLHEGYDHNCVDVEFVETAMDRGAWAFAVDAHVEHLHPIWRKGSSDATYVIGQSAHLRDMKLLRERWNLWHHREVIVALQRSRRTATLSAGQRRQIKLR